MSQFRSALFFISLFFLVFLNSCHFLSKSSNYARKTANDKEKINPFEFTTVPMDWLKAYPEIYKELTEIIEYEKNEIAKYAKEHQDSFSDSNLLPFQFDIVEVRKFNELDPNIISVRARFYIFTGGSHGNTYHISWNWNKKDKKFLSLSDYIKTKSDFNRFKTAIKKSVSTNKDVDLDVVSVSSVDLFELQDFKAWNLHKDTEQGDQIVFVFDPYDIGPYSAGFIEVSIPKSFNSIKL